MNDNSFDPSKFLRKSSKPIAEEETTQTEQITEPQEQLENLPQEEITQETQKIEKPFDPNQFARSKTESWPEWYSRNNIRSQARVLEGFFGTPGNIKEFITDLSKSTLQSEMSEDEFVASIKAMENMDQMDPKIKEILTQETTTIPIPLPTTGKLREVTGKISAAIGKKNYTEPKNYWEEMGDEVLTDFGSMLFPGGAGRNAFEKIGIAVAGNVGKEAIDLFGGSEKQKTYGKFGFMIALDIASRGNARHHARNLLHQAENSIPLNSRINGLGFLNMLNNLEAQIRIGGVAPSDRPALQVIAEFRARIDPNNPMIDPRELLAMNRNINEVRANIGAFDVPAHARPRASRHLNEVHNALNDTIRQYGQRNQQFANLWQRGNEAYAVWAQSNAISNFVQRYYTKPFFSDATKMLFFSGVGQTTKNFPASLTSAAAVAAPYQAIKMLYRVSQSAELRRYYAGVMAASAAGNVGLMKQNLEKLDKALERQDIKRTQELARKKQLA